MKHGVVTCAVLLLISAGAPRAAAAVSGDFSLGVDLLRGDTTYQIGGKVSEPGVTSRLHFPVSELSFPLDVYLLTGAGRLSFEPGYGLVTFGARVSTSISGGAGSMEDSDWGVWFLQYGGSPRFSRRSLDIFSRSDAELTALDVDLSADFRFFERAYDPVTLRFSAGGAFRYQDFDYEVRDLVQEYPSSLSYFGRPMPVDVVPGKVLTYEAVYTIPSLRLGTEILFGERLSLSGLLGYSPFVHAEDDDDHVLRFKRNKGKGDGDAWYVSLAGRWTFWSRWYAFLSYDYLRIATEGTQRQTWYRTTKEAPAGFSLSVDQKIESTQSRAGAGVGVTF